MITDLKKENRIGNLIILVLALAAIFMMMKSIGAYKDVFQNFSTIFISIVLEATPFIILGAFIASLIHVYITEDFIKNAIPKSKVGSIFIASILGIVFPVCECAIVPITKNLIHKGVPKGAAITFMLAVPLVNPIVLLSTYYAFYNRPDIVVIRGVLGLIAAITVGLAINFAENDYEVLKEAEVEAACTDQCNFCEHEHHHHKGHDYYDNNQSKLSMVIEHASEEFYDTAKYLIMGATLSALFQTIISKRSISFLGDNLFYSILTMMVLAFILSICSTADAFIAKTFLNQFTIGSVIAFMIMGPMLDIKNTFMLIGAFRGKFVINLILYILLVCFAAGAVVNILAMFGVI
ncbi:permease [Clostridium oryzae]|uniref:Putative two-component membrane permease complex subunit n=1 Tax=Clostridium oryzae TaxID=1450648 RepID=A0A1V4IDM2_9CLOT|nr:permease [Clostridium oryzae]OPJ58092.1 putative two-component membrane permease complex subunit [Clostridium oryzae]